MVKNHQKHYLYFYRQQSDRMSKRATMQSPILIVKKRKHKLIFPWLWLVVFTCQRTRMTATELPEMSAILQLIGNPGLKMSFFILDIHIIVN